MGRECSIHWRIFVMIPSYLTEEQWFDWAAQYENRFGKGIHDAEAQKRFLTAWYFSKIGVDSSVLLSKDAVAALQEVKSFSPGLRLPRFLHHIYSGRADLRRAFPPDDRKTPENLLKWYNIYGVKEFASASAHLLGGKPGDASVQMQNREMQKRSFDRLKSVSSDGALGVNIVGYAQGEFGLGEDVRTLAKCLDVANIDYCVFNLTEGSNARLEDHSLDHKFSDTPSYPVTILCVSPFEIPRVRREFAEKLFEGKYVIAYAPWEIETYPRVWVGALSWVDELWAISRHVLESYKGVTSTPCVFMPPAVDIWNPPRRKKASGRPFQFVCSYDPNSFVTRKNPDAAANAFKIAFPDGNEDASLLFLVNGKNPHDKFTSRLADIARADPRIKYLIGTHSRRTYIELLAAADCFLSPHRAEGFGRNIAEAKALGVQVLSTGYSGPVDFTDENEQVAWSYVPVGKEGYIYSEDAQWAEIDILDLATKMRRLYENRTAVSQVRLAEIYTIKQAADRYRNRLTQIGSLENNRELDLIA
jgi:glycosyltransferase involved in cell wall biosynthesis